MPATPRASLYVRLSRAATVENVSLDGMVADVRAVCAREGFAEVALHVDDGRSGAVRDRPEFLAWLADAREGRADVLVAWHADRMTREGLNVAATLLDVVEGKDATTGREVHRPVRLMDAKGLDSDDGAAFRFRFVIAAEVAREERERMRDRNASKAVRLRAAGRWPGGVEPYGYRAAQNPDGPGKVLEVHPQEAAVIRRAADQVLSGVPVLRVVKRLNADGIPPRRAAAWSPRAMRQVLTGDAVLGRLRLRGEVQRDEHGRAIAAFEPILTVEQVQALRAALAPRPAQAPKRRRAARLLSGLLNCHSCGEVLHVTHRRHGPRTDDVLYRCMARTHGRPCAEPVSIAAPLLEEHLSSLFLADVGRFPYAQRRLVSGSDNGRAAVEEAYAAAHAAVGKAPTPEAFARLQALHAERERLAASAPPEPRVEWIDTGRTVAEEWERAAEEDRREILGRYLLEVRVRRSSRRTRGAIDPERLLVTTARDLGDEVPWWDLEDDDEVRAPRRPEAVNAGDGADEAA